MKRLSISLYSALIITSSLSSGAMAQSDDGSAVAFVMRELVRANESANDQGLAMRQAFVGHVDQGSSFSHAIRTDRAEFFVVKGYCDRDCNDMDLELVDSNNRIIMADTGIDDTPELRFASSDVASGSRIRAKMHNCSTSICYYSVGLFSD